MKLLYSDASPFARKVRAAAIELGLHDRIELVPVVVMPGHENKEYAAEINPLRKIPALITDAGDTVFDSTIICDYLDSQAGNKLVPAGGEGRWRVLTQAALAQGICDAAVLIRYETWLRPEALRWDLWIDDQLDKALSGLAWFEARPETLGGDLNLAQITLGCALGYLDFRFEDQDWRKSYPTIKGFFEALGARESFLQTDPRGPRAAS